MTGKIISLDLATVTGFVVGTMDGTIIESGIKDFSIGPTKDESREMKYKRFKYWLTMLISAYNIEFVCYEKPGGRHFTGVRSHSNFEGVLLAEAPDDSAWKAYSATEIKKYAKGLVESSIGNPNKDHMYEWASEYFTNVEVEDHNHADALWMFYLFISQFKS